VVVKKGSILGDKRSQPGPETGVGDKKLTHVL